jgi:hypothetical protein
MSAVKAPKDNFRVEVEKQHGAILEALDKLYAYEVPARGGKSVLRLVQPGETIDHDPTGQKLRDFIERRGWDLWTIGGELELFGGLRAVMAAQPHRQRWNRTMLSGIWAQIGMPEQIF